MENGPNLTFQESPKTILSLLKLKVLQAYIGLSKMNPSVNPYLIIGWQGLESTGGLLRSGLRGGTGPWGQYKTPEARFTKPKL